ncbi:MAG: efflux RND transporter permease subunit [Thiotrichaceae bacterium]|nr:efflux RND transporter permease subunit [Thiotrichaceae bacterium]PCI12951.1 MAG: cobalt-zinc-cadmium resistance protein [Thiotrichales bacterium]
MRLIRFSIDNPLITNLMLALVLIMGVLSWYQLPQEMFPVVEMDKVKITTVYKGTSPEEMERLVSLPIEEEFDDMMEIDTITSTSSEGLSNIIIDLKSGTDVTEFVNDARSILERIADLPDDAERPELSRMKSRIPVISVALYGDVSRSHLFELAEEVKRRLLSVPGVASAGISGNREWELWVEVDPARMAMLKIPLSQITQVLRANLDDLPGGSIQAAEGDILLRGKGVVPDAAGISQLVLRRGSNGAELLLGEVANVSIRLEEPRTLARFNGRSSVNMIVTKTAESSTIEISKQVRELARQMRDELPSSVKLGVFSDLSVYVKTRLETVKSSAVVGLILVLLSLYLFLNFRVALITALGIPVSFLFAVILMETFGVTINMVSLFAFLVVLGMVVDDAIIVTENIYRHMENGVPAERAAIVGAREVYWPVVASTATTIAAFMPMFAIGGTMGAFIAVIPIIVICTLIGSLIEAFGVLPSHAKEMLKVQKRKTRPGMIDWKKWLERYTHFVRWSLHNRYFMCIAIIGLMLITIVTATTRSSFELFGSVDSGQFFINAEAPNTYSLQDTTVLAKQMEEQVIAELNDNELESQLTNVGVTFIDFNTIKFDSNYIQLVIDLKKPRPEGFIDRWISPVVSLRFNWDGTRERSTTEIINRLRERMQTIAGIQRLSILRPAGGPAGADIEIGIVGNEFDLLREIGEEVKTALLTLPGVYDIRQDLEPGKLEYQYTLNDRGRQLGLTQARLAEAIRGGYQGIEVAHVTHDNKRMPVRVIYPKSVREQASSLGEQRIVLENGKSVYFEDVADIKFGRSFGSVKRRDMQRLATVTAEVDAMVTTPIEVTNYIQEQFSDLSQRHPGLELVFMGEKREASESMRDMTSAFIIALALIFFILAALFKSLLDPLVVMFAIPFGIIGVIFGHFVMGFHLQFLSAVGFLALAGIIVNDSLILVDFANKMRAKGEDRIEAMVAAGRVRARPILLTSVTTFLGISPLIFFSTGQTAFLAPMAVSLGFGLLFATVLILIGVPCFYMVADDLRAKSSKIFRAIFRSDTKESSSAG